jgi:hypothetical protein
MTTTQTHGPAFWALQLPGWFLLLYLIYAQGISAFGYHLGVTMGTQEPVEMITEVGAAFWYGFALGDLVVYIPMLCVGLIGHVCRAPWGRVILAAALGITVYWPVVSLAALVAARDAAGWNVSDEMPYWVVCPLLAVWGAWGLWFIMSESHHMHASDASETARSV